MLLLGGKVCQQKLLTTLLHGQLQDGLKHELMRAAAVSGTQSYKALFALQPKINRKVTS